MVRLVFDFGTSGIRVGRATDHFPVAEIPTTVGTLNEFPHDEPRKKCVVDKYKFDIAHENMECGNLIKDGMIEDWDMLLNIIDHIYVDCIRSLPIYHPVLITEFPWNTTEKREKLTEIMFESYSVPALFLAKSPALATIASGISTGLVIDSGTSFTTVVPVINGLTQIEALVKSPIAGNYLSNICQQFFQESNIELTPPFFIKNLPLSKATESWYDYNMNTCTDEFKTTVLEVSDTPFHELQLCTTTSKSFKFPNKKTHLFGLERYKLAEVMFNPGIYKNKSRTWMEMGVGQLVQTSVDKLDEVTRKSLDGNIIITGGNTFIKGFDRRLINDLVLIFPCEKLHVFASNSCSGRRLQSWIGGKALASNEMFHTLWMTQAEYYEHGKSYAYNIFP